MESVINDLDKRLDELSQSMAVMSNNLEVQGKSIEKLTESFQKLAVFIERTNDNGKKIEAIFKKLDEINEKGTKNCPVNSQRITTCESRVDKLANYAIGALLAVAMQFLAILVFIIEKQVKL